MRINALQALGLAITSIVAATGCAALPTSNHRSVTRPAAEVLVVGATTVRFDIAGATVTAGTVSIGMNVTSVARGQNVLQVDAGPVRRADGNARRHIGDGVTEWWRRGARGLEHGLDLVDRPAGAGPLFVDLRVTHATVRGSADGVVFLDAASQVVGSYTHLAVIDARGERLPARLEARGDTIRIAVQDGLAEYPIQIDPLVVVQEAVLLPAAWRSYAERASAISGDGSRVAVGNGRQAWVFVRAGTTWTEEASLTPTFMGTMAATALALDDSGSVAVLGIFGEDTAAGTGSGGARIFQRAATTWTETAVLYPPDGAAFDMFGFSVTLASDGTRAAVGAIRDATARGLDAGTAHVFRREGMSWVHEATLEPPATRTVREFGVSLDLDDTGTRCVVGATPDTGTLPGGAYVFVRTGTSWALESELSPPLGPGVRFGSAAAISGDSSRALVGSGADVPPGQTAHVFRREGSRWLHESTLTTVAPRDVFGGSAALDRTGTLAVLARSHWTDGDTLAMFSRVGTGWSEEGSLAVPPGYGGAVGLDASATRVVIARPEGGAVVYTVETAGGPCTTASDCRTGYCVDGVCCNDGCGGGAVDCAACSLAAGGTRDGLCGPLESSAAMTTVCRAAADPCDAAEYCQSTSTTCPIDSRAAAGVLCRAAVGACDLPEVCSSSRVCPADGLVSAGTQCRPSEGLCDPAEACTGTSADCPADAYSPAGAPCRPSASPCDLEEVCPGEAAACPSDQHLPDGESCVDPDPCNGEESCVAGECVRGAVLDCDDADPCTLDSCSPRSGCRHALGSCADGWTAGPDAAVPDAAVPDAGSSPGDAAPATAMDGSTDAGHTAPASGGCHCHAGAPDGSSPAYAVGLGLLVAASRRRRDRVRAAGPRHFSRQLVAARLAPPAAHASVARASDDAGRQRQSA